MARPIQMTMSPRGNFASLMRRLSDIMRLLGRRNRKGIKILILHVEMLMIILTKEMLHWSWTRAGHHALMLFGLYERIPEIWSVQSLNFPGLQCHPMLMRNFQQS